MISTEFPWAKKLVSAGICSAVAVLAVGGGLPLVLHTQYLQDGASLKARDQGEGDKSLAEFQAIVAKTDKPFVPESIVGEIRTFIKTAEPRYADMQGHSHPRVQTDLVQARTRVDVLVRYARHLEEEFTVFDMAAAEVDSAEFEGDGEDGDGGENPDALVVPTEQELADAGIDRPRQQKLAKIGAHLLKKLSARSEEAYQAGELDRGIEQLQRTRTLLVDRATIAKAAKLPTYQQISDIRNVRDEFTRVRDGSGDDQVRHACNLGVSYAESCAEYYDRFEDANRYLESPYSERSQATDYLRPYLRSLSSAGNAFSKMFDRIKARRKTMMDPKWKDPRKDTVDPAKLS